METFMEIAYLISSLPLLSEVHEGTGNLSSSGAMTCPDPLNGTLWAETGCAMTNLR